MRSFQKYLEIALNNFPHMLLAEMVRDKLEDQGIFLNKAKIAKVTQKLIDGELEGYNIFPWKFWDNKKVTLNFTEDDLKKIETESDEFLNNKLSGLMLSVSSEMAPKILKDLKKQFPTALRKDRNNIKGFKNRLMKRWGRPLDSLKFLLMMSREFGEEIYQDLLENSNDDKPYLIDALARLHGRACQVTYEIICLLENGLADGAMSRWRTLHEISVIALFLSEHGETVAERYIEFQQVESWKALQQYIQHYEILRQQPPSDDEMQEVQEAFEKLINKYGKDFRNEYGWASDCLQRQNPKFSDLEKACKIDHLRPFYKMASYSTHANPKGIYFQMSSASVENLILAGPSNAGLADPGHNTALSLMKVWVALSTIDPTFDTILFSKMMNLLAYEIGDKFLKAHNKLEEDEEKIDRSYFTDYANE